MGSRITTALDGALARGRINAPAVLLAALAAGVAWLLASSLLHQPQTFFAPIAAIVVLLGGVGARAGRALHVVLGVSVGVVVGELVALLDWPDPLKVLVAAGVAMLVMSLLYTDALPLIQSGVGAVLVIVMHQPATAVGRLSAALLGAAVALVFTLVLFTPSPSRLLADAIGRVLDACAAALRAGAESLRAPEDGGRDHDGEAERTAVDALSTLDSTRGSARYLGRWSVRGRRETARREEMDALAARLVTFAVDVTALSRAASTGRLELGAAEVLDGLADAVTHFSSDPRSPDRARATRNATDGVLATDATARCGAGADQMLLVADGLRALTGGRDRVGRR
ncbi:fusaric acid resistance family protein [Pseudonocardia sediminis]|uniref:Fusaric acid resistance family protein n=1 Tax=Pseudonocardia sediminis TaxID=1397368 RepID=A0A4V2FR90_PSEST|nr:FUSC family protein [Pseudonocardia sediminis]RZT87670.1 fusaric acid resistance family protein [Pseudonocardia sediminis]